MSTPRTCGWNGCRNRVAATSTDGRCWIREHHGPAPVTGPAAAAAALLVPALTGPAVTAPVEAGDPDAWPASMDFDEIAAWAAAGFTAADAHDWRSEWDVPLVLAARWRDAGITSTDELATPGYRALPFDPAEYTGSYCGPRDRVSTEEPMLNRPNLIHLCDSFTHPLVRLEPNVAEMFVWENRIRFEATILTHDDRQVGYLDRTLQREDDGTWTLENTKLLLGQWDEDEGALAAEASAVIDSATRSGLQGQGIGSAIADHVERELKALVPQTARVRVFSIDDLDALAVGGYQNARRGFDWDPAREDFDEKSRKWVKVPPRKQVHKIWDGGGRTRVAALLEAGHITRTQFDDLEAAMTAKSGKLPTPGQLADWGRGTPLTLEPGAPATHVGKVLMVGSAWHGIKTL